MEQHVHEYVQGILPETAKGLIVNMNTSFKGKVGEIVKICIYLVRLMTGTSTQKFLYIVACIHTEKQSNLALS